MISLDVRGDVVEARVLAVLPNDAFRAYLASCKAAGARFESAPARHVLPRASYVAFHDALMRHGIETTTKHDDAVSRTRDHAYVTPADCKHGPQKEGCCGVCDGGLLLCRACGLGEGALTTECCGERVSDLNSDLVYNCKLDFVNGKWRAKDLVCHCGEVASRHGMGDYHQFKHAGDSEHDFVVAPSAHEVALAKVLIETSGPGSIAEGVLDAQQKVEGHPEVGGRVADQEGGHGGEGTGESSAGESRVVDRGGKAARRSRAKNRSEEVAPLALLVCSQCGGEWMLQENVGEVTCVNGHSEALANVSDEPFVIRPYQRDGIDWLQTHPCTLLADQPGIGKTLQGLRAAGRDVPILVVCPASVKNVWRDEAAKFRPDLKVTIISGRFVRLCEEHAVGRHCLDPKKGTKRARPALALENDESESAEDVPSVSRVPTVHKCAECPPRRKKVAIGRYSVFRWPELNEVVVLNPEIVPKTWKDAPRGLRVIADEAHAYAYSDSARTRSVRALVVVALKAGGGAWAFTGTPMFNAPNTLWCLLVTFKLHPWATRDEFDVAFGGVKDSWGKTTWPDVPPTDVRSQLKPYMLRRLKADVLTDLPPLTIQDVVVDVDVKARAAGDKVLALLAELGLPIEALIDAENKADFAATALDPELRKKLSPEQWAEARHRLLALLAEAREALVRAKLPAILEFIENVYESSGEQLVVFSAHRIVVETLQGRPGWAGILGGMGKPAVERVLDRFVTGEVRYITATIRTIGVGINKLVGCSNVVLADWEYVPALNSQAIDRHHRLGQKNPVLVRRFVADHPLDRRVLDALTKKENLQNAVVG